MSAIWRLAGALALVSSQGFAATPFFSQTFPAYSNTNWQLNGTVAESAYGLGSGGSGSGSLIYKNAIPDGTSEYEVRVRYRFNANGGSLVTYLRATQNAQLTMVENQATPGNFYAVEVNNPQGANRVYVCDLAIWKNYNNDVTPLASRIMTCRDNMVLRFLVKNGFIWVFKDEFEPYLLFIEDASITTGNPGVGARITPAGNAIAQVELYPADRTAPPQAPVPAVTAFDNRIEMQWPAVNDGSQGSGIYLYRLYRWDGSGWVWRVDTYKPGWVDEVNVQPGVTYTYLFHAIDFHLNFSADRTFTVQAAPAGSKDPRQIGLRNTGTHWGGAGEQIDVMSGNLNLTVPILKAEARGGWGVTFALNYNSQLWRQDGGGTWKYGSDVGYGFGWKLLAGSITPIYESFYVVDHYRFTDSSGAEYRLDQNAGGIWTSTEGIYVSYEAATKKLWFNDGSFWLMNVESNGAEEDAGTLYPSLMQDSNGNQIKIRYKTGINWFAPNSSARIDEIEDVKASSTSGGYHTYKFLWSTDPLPHLTYISPVLGGPGERSFTYGDRTLSSPWGAAAGTTKVLESTTNSATGRPHSMVYTTAGELNQVVYPYGGMLRWDFRNFTYNGSRTIREVQYRWMRKATSGNPETVHVFGHDDANDANRSYHAMSFINISGLPGDKVWYFNTDRRLSLYHERAAGAVVKVQREYAWAYSNPGNSGPYVSQVTTTIEPGPNQLVSRVQQTLDGYGNLTQMKQYDFGLSEADARTYTNTYLTDANWTSRYIRNRLKVSTLTKGAYSAELARNYYDHEPRPDCGSGNTMQTIPGNNQRQHDSATYTSTYHYRGNPKSVKRPGYAGCLGYDVTGTVRSKTDNAGTTSITTQSSTNYAAPSQVTANGFTTSMSWTSLLQLDTQTGLNGEVVNFDYNANGDLSETTTPYGLKTTHVLSPTTNLLTTTTGMPNVVGQPAKPKRWTKKYLDGFGRAVKVETGYTNNGVETKLSTVDTEYEACACTPMGKVKRVSRPYASGSPLWTVYAYDELGRVTSVTPPANTGTGAGAPTTYTYAGNMVTVTEPQTTRWKRYTMDAFGNLTWVNEPKHGSGEYATLYQYTPLNQLQSVTMVRNGRKNSAAGNYTQVRTFNWGTDGRLSSTTFPENGTTTYTYTANGQLYEKFDAKGQKIRHEYDDKRRLTVVRKYPNASGSEDPAQRVTYHYDTNPFGASLNTTGRLTAAEYGTQMLGGLRESYTYDIPGSMTMKRLGQYDASATLWKLDAVYTYDEEGRPKTLKYPNNGYTYTHNYDAASRPTTMTHEEAGSTVTDATVGGFNAAGQMTAFNFLYEGANFANTFGFNNRNQLTGITITRGVQNYASFTYNYHTSLNNGRVQNMVRQMWNTAGTQVVNETVTYGYDTPGRLTSTTATTGISGQAWSQSFTYDGFGNLYNTVGTGLAAPFDLNSEASLNSEKNQIGAHDANGNPTGLTFDVDNRLKAQGVYTFGYAPDNKRVVRSKDIGGQWEHEVAFYSGSRRLGRYRVTAPGGTWLVETIHEERYFAGKALMPQDRLGSAAHAWLLPYGQELTNGQNPTEPNDRVKFATYTRDQSGYDYADQRYYGYARFLTPDPYMASGGTSAPSSWNRYTYVEGDPVNKVDPTGLNACPAQYGFDACVAMGYVGHPGGATDPADWCWDIANRFGNTAYGFLQTTACGAWMIPGTPLMMAAMQNPPVEDRKKRIAHHLKIGRGAFGAPGDCYHVPSRGSVTREIRYELYDEEDQRLATGVISERLTGSSMPMSGETSSPTNNGVYTDTISLLTERNLGN